MTLPAFTRRRCSNRSISPARSAYGHAGTDRQTDGRTDTLTLHRPCCAYYYAGCASNLQLIQRIATSVYSYCSSVRSRICRTTLHQFLCAFVACGRGSVLFWAASRYVMYFRFCVWCRVYIVGLSVTQQRRSRANAPATWYWMCPITDNSRCQESVAQENRVRSL